MTKILDVMEILDFHNMSTVMLNHPDLRWIAADFDLLLFREKPIYKDGCWVVDSPDTSDWNILSLVAMNELTHDQNKVIYNLFNISAEDMIFHTLSGVTMPLWSRMVCHL